MNPKLHGTKAAAHYVCEIPAGESAVLRLRLAADHTESHHSGAGKPVEGNGQPVDVANLALSPAEFDQVFVDRRREADEFYEDRIPVELKPEQREVARQGYAGLLWSKQFYEYIVKDWLEGDPEQPTPPAGAVDRPQQRMDAAAQPRCDFDARQMGISLVRRVGFGVSPGGIGAGRFEIRQGSGGFVFARMVHAPQRSTAGVRICAVAM